MSFWESFGNLRWIWIEGDIWLSLALIKIIRWFIAKLWMICKPWRWIKVMVSWQQVFYGKIGIRQLVCQQDQKRETRTWWAAAYVFAYDMWVHLKVRHLDIYCRRVVSVVSVTFLAKPFPPLHQLPFDCNKHLNFALLMLNTSHITKFLKPHVPKAVSSNSPWLVFPKSTALSKRMSAWWAWPLQQRQMSKLWFDVMSEVLHVK